MIVTFFEYLQHALRTLEREHARYADAMWAALGGRVVFLRVGDEAVRLRAREVTRVSVSARGDDELGCGDGALRVRTTRSTIVALAEGELRLLDAILDDALALWGTADDLAAGREAFAAFLGGAVRSPSFPALLEDFRRWCRG